MRTLEEIRNATGLRIVTVAIDGGMGEVQIGKWRGSVIWSYDGGWDHVSVAPYNRRIIPSWEDMCRLKDMFWRDDEVVIQIHPAKSEYVNNMPNCLHLWRCTCAEQPTPPSIYVGIRDEQTARSVIEEIREVCAND